VSNVPLRKISINKKNVISVTVLKFYFTAIFLRGWTDLARKETSGVFNFYDVPCNVGIYFDALKILMLKGHGYDRKDNKN
jgi:hypothetical protein